MGTGGTILMRVVCCATYDSPSVCSSATSGMLEKYKTERHRLSGMNNRQKLNSKGGKRLRRRRKIILRYRRIVCVVSLLRAWMCFWVV